MLPLDLLGAVLSVLVLAGLTFWLWMLVDCLKNPTLEGKDKLVWMLVLILLNVFGAAAYFALARPQPSNEP